MRNIKICLAAAAAALFSMPANADSVLHIWTCQLNDGKTGEDLMAVTEAWLDAAKAIDGGADIELSLEFPIAANVEDGTFNFVMSIENARTWGEWEQNYPGSRASEVDEDWGEVATCQNSSLWNSVTID